MNTKSKLAFSLIELSIVILVIGILVIGITKGSRIISSAKIKSAQSLTNSSPVNSMADMVLWIDSTSIKSFDANIANNSEIANWYDINPRSDDKHNFTQNTTGKYPLYKTKLLNGLPGVLFDGSDDWMSTAHSDALNPLENGFTVFFVSKVLGSGSVFHLSKGNVNSTDVGYSYLSTSVRSLGSGGSNTQSILTSIPNVNPTIIAFTFSGSQARYYLNNSEATPISYIGSINSTSDLTIGSRASGSINSNIEIYELIMFKRQLKSGEISSINKYLGQKWGITVS